MRIGLLAGNKIVSPISNWRTVIQCTSSVQSVHFKFVFNGACQQPVKSHSPSFMNFNNLLTWVLVTQQNNFKVTLFEST